MPRRFGRGLLLQTSTDTSCCSALGHLLAGRRALLRPVWLQVAGCHSTRLIKLLEYVRVVRVVRVVRIRSNATHTPSSSTRRPLLDGNLPNSDCRRVYLPVGLTLICWSVDEIICRTRSRSRVTVRYCRRDTRRLFLARPRLWPVNPAHPLSNRYSARGHCWMPPRAVTQSISDLSGR